MAGIFNKIVTAWCNASAPSRIVAVNVAVFAIIWAGCLICKISGLSESGWIGMWAMPAGMDLLLRPWTPFAYMFTQYEATHLIFNMLWFYGFARVFMIFSSPRQLIGLYVYSGLAGAALFVAGVHIFQSMSIGSASLLGSSAAVMGIVTGAASVYPDMPVRLMLIGDVKLKWLAVAALVLLGLCTYTGNIGVQMAHLGGALMGLYYGVSLRRGKDICKPFENMTRRVQHIFSTSKPRMPKVKRYKPKGKQAKKTTSGPNTTRQEFSLNDQEVLDAILDKVKKSGYAGLSSEEKRKLFDVSRRIK